MHPDLQYYFFPIAVSYDGTSADERAKAESAYRPSCAGRMGKDDMAVVDGEGRVHGMEALRVVNTSIMPKVASGNMNVR